MMGDREAREAFTVSVWCLVNGYDLVPSIAAAELICAAARLIAETGAWPHRCDRAATLLREKIAEFASGAPFPELEAMVEAYHAEIERLTARKRKKGYVS